MREDIIFLPPAPAETPFYILMTGISYCDGSYRITRKCSTPFIVEYVIKGTGTIKINGKTYHPSEGDAYILPMFTDHTYYADPVDPWEKIWIDARGILPSELQRMYHLEDVIRIENLNIYPQLKQIFDLAGNNQLKTDEINQQAARIFLHIMQLMSDHVHQGQNSISEEAKTLKFYLDDHVGKEVTIQELSNQIFRSPFQTIRIFKKAFHCTPHDYALNLKIETAKLFLKNTTLQIKEIAHRLNFTDEHYFSNVFRNKTGVSPRQFRNQ